MSAPRRLRVLHAPATVGGHAQGLAAAERELGVDSRSLAFFSTPVRYDVDDVLFERARGPLGRELRRYRLLARALRDFDVVHFNFGSSLLPRPHPEREAAGLAGSVWNAYARLVELRDLPLLRRAGKGIFVTYQGDDARLAAYCRDRFEISVFHDLRTPHEAEVDEARRRGIARFARYAHAIYAVNPDLLHVLPERAEFVPYSNLDPRDWTPAAASDRSGPPIVVHAPSDRLLKGTSHLLDAVERLRGEGVELELDLVEGVPREEARRRYARADLLVDQLLAGWYGGAAVEAMALGKPVVAYLRPDDLAFLPEAMRQQLPVIDATPDGIADVLREWLTVRRGELADRGRAGRAYVERWHDPLEIARRTVRDYEQALR